MPMFKIIITTITSVNINHKYKENGLNIPLKTLSAAM